MDTKKIIGFLIIVFLGALLSTLHWSLLVVAAVIGGYLIEDTKKAVSAFLAGIFAWGLLLSRYVFSPHFGAVNTFVNSVAGLPALPLMLLIGGILSLLGAFIGVTAKKAFKK